MRPTTLVAPCASLLALLAAACAGVWGFDEGAPAEGSTGAGGSGGLATGGSGGQATTTGGSAAGGVGGGAGSAGKGGQGGSVPECGNTAVETGEQCDDGNQVPGDGCDECAWECLAPDVEWIATGACYHLGPMFGSWNESRAYCQGWRASAELVGISTPEELSFLSATSLTPYEYMHIGALDPNDDNTSWHWVNGELWGHTAWFTGEPETTAGEQCATLRVNEWSGWRDSPCTGLGGEGLCEWKP